MVPATILAYHPSSRDERGICTQKAVQIFNHGDQVQCRCRQIVCWQSFFRRLSFIARGERRECSTQSRQIDMTRIAARSINDACILHIFVGEKKTGSSRWNGTIEKEKRVRESHTHTKDEGKKNMTEMRNWIVNKEYTEISYSIE